MASPRSSTILLRFAQSICGLVLALSAAGCLSEWPSGVREAYRHTPDEVDYNFDVQPILSDRCYPCHGPDENTREADLRLDTEEGALLTTLESGVTPILPGNPLESVLVHRILDADPDEMMPPPESKLLLSDAEKAILIKWIEQGAEWKPHWSFSRPTKPEVPVLASDWGHNPIDAFVRSRLIEEGLEPSPEADSTTLLRRLTLDLTGLPPTLEELDAFLEDESEHAYEKVVDRLLAAPEYGERWAWDWLDAARYADTNGFQGDPTRTMWPWRDWVVDAINKNLPYDQFTVEQLAGDLLEAPTQDQVLATGFNRNHMYNGEGGRIPEETRVENVFDRVETLGTVWMGLTVNCSRCHDHKFDPLTQREYYQLYDYFNQTSEIGSGFNGKVEPVLDLSEPGSQEKFEALQRDVGQQSQKVSAIEDVLFPREEGKSPAESPAATGLIGENVDALRLQPLLRSGYYLGLLIKSFEASEPAYAEALQDLLDTVRARDAQSAKNIRVMVMDELEERRTSYILEGGIYNRPADSVFLGVPAFLPPLPDDAPANRLALAEWLVAPEHPLTARVTVNRFWQSFFGTGLVKTVDDFGIQGEKPSHPGLLDWLAVDFMENGWDVKALHKLIVMSATYRQASVVRPELLERDPDNRLLARGTRHRLPSWMIRDQALAVSGLLVDKKGGTPVFTYQPAGIWSEATFGQKVYEQDSGESLYRRTLYSFWRRIVGPTMLFDTSARQVCSVSQQRTNTPMHALITLNDITYVEAGRKLGERMLLQEEEDLARMEYGFRLATSRYPEEAELDILQERLETLRGQYRLDKGAAEALLNVGESASTDGVEASELAAWAGIGRLLLNLDETISKQ